MENAHFSTIIALALIAGSPSVARAQVSAPTAAEDPATPQKSAFAEAKENWNTYKIPSSVGLGLSGGGDGGGIGMVFNFRLKVIGVDYLYQPHQDADVDASVPHSDYSSTDKKMDGYVIHGYIPLTSKKNVSVMIGRANYTYTYLAQSNVTGWTWSGGGGAADAGKATSYGIAWTSLLKKNAVRSSGDATSGGGVELRYDKLRGFSLVGNFCF